MNRIGESVLNVLLVFVLLTILSRISSTLPMILNILSLVVLYYAIERGEIWGACLGLICGLIQDSFSIGVFGVMGTAKTIVGFLGGYISLKINIHPWFRKTVFLFALLTLELMIWIFLYSLIFDERVYTGRGVLYLQPLVTALVGGIVFIGIRRFQQKKKSGTGYED